MKTSQMPKTKYISFFINRKKIRLAIWRDGNEPSFTDNLREAAEIYARKFHGKSACVHLNPDGYDLEDGLAYERTYVNIFKGHDRVESFVEVSDYGTGNSGFGW
jgi:hypothetical protein